MLNTESSAPRLGLGNHDHSDVEGQMDIRGNQEWAAETEKGRRFAGRPLGFAVMTEVLGCREAGFRFWETALRQGQRQGQRQGEGQGQWVGRVLWPVWRDVWLSMLIWFQ